jgi:CheY-like chemotaxis protein
LPKGYYGPTRTILVIDDRWEDRAALQDILTPIGFTVIEASSDREGCNLAQRYHPDVIIVDLSLPRVNGLELIQQLRRYPDFDLTVIFALSKSALYSAHELTAAGCNGCFTKPIDRHDLLAQLQFTLNLTWRYPANPDAP